MANIKTNAGAAKEAAPAENNELKELKEMMAQKDKENQELKDMIKQLGELVRLSNQNSMNTAQPVQETDNDLVYVTNNSIGKQLISIDRLGQTSIIIKGLEKNRPLERSYIKQAMQLIQMRKLFEFGILEFDDEKYYKIYGIEKKFDMSEENVLKMFSVENISKTVSELTTLFKRPESSALKHELCYKTLDLVSKGQLPMEETNTINVSLNKIFCSRTNVQFNALLSNLPFKKGEA